MANEYTRNIQDLDFVESIALPAAAATAYSPSLDLEQVLGGLIESIAFEASIPATPNLVEAKTITVSVEDSADNSSFAAIDPAITTVVTGAGAAAGGAAKSVRFRLPPTARRYVRMKIVMLAAAGDNTGVDLTFKALF